MNFPGRIRIGGVSAPLDHLYNTPLEFNHLAFAYFTPFAQFRLVIDLYAPFGRRDFGYSAGAAQACGLEQFYQFDGVAFYPECRHESRLSGSTVGQTPAAMSRGCGTAIRGSRVVFRSPLHSRQKKPVPTNRTKARSRPSNKTSLPGLIEGVILSSLIGMRDVGHA